MIKIRAFKNKYWDNKFLIGSIIYALIFIAKFNFIKIYSIDINNLLMDILGNLDINSHNIAINYSNYILNYILIVYVCFNYIEKDFNKNSIYIFTRTNNKRKWINLKIINLTLIISTYFIFQYIILFFLGIFLGFKIVNLYNFVIATICIILNLIINSTIVALISNIICFKSKSIFGYFFSVGIFSLCILLTYIFKILKLPKLYMIFIPFVSSITGWYGFFNSIINRQLNNFAFYINNNSFLCNILINVMLIFILGYAINKIINNMDIL